MSALRPPRGLIRSETTKLATSRSAWILGVASIVGTWPMAWANATQSVGVSATDPRLFSAQPVAVQYQGIEMAGFGYVLVIALAAQWAHSEYGTGQPIRTTLLATPQRIWVFVVKSVLLVFTVAVVAFVTMSGTLVITHLAADSGIDPWALTPEIWANVGGVTLAWTLTASIAFSVGVLARTAIVPMIVMIPMVIGVGDFLATFWDGARYLPVAAGAALYSDPSAGVHLGSVTGALVLGGWTLVLFAIAAIVFAVRDQA